MTIQEREAAMPQAVIDDEMIAAMEAKAGAQLRIDHSVNNEYASRIAVTKFAGGIGDINPLWTDQDHARASPYGAPVAPPSFVIGCFSGIQFGWPGLGSFHSRSHLTFQRPVYWGDMVNAGCVYEGFDGPSPSSFAGRTVTDRFRNTYTNQDGTLIATIDWEVINFERGSASSRRKQAKAEPVLPHPWSEDELKEIEAGILAETPRGAQPRFWEDVTVGASLDVVTKGPIGMTDEIAFVAGGGTPIPRLKAHAAALHDYAAHPAWSFRDPVTAAQEPIYSVHYNLQAARAMSVAFQYDVGFQRQCWQLHHLTHWAGDHAWIKEARAEYRKFVYLSDVVRLGGTITGKRVDEDGEHVIDIATEAVNQRDEVVMPGSAVIALPSRHTEGSPAARRARERT
ncbi:MaoC family dehydratase N-terminal domain-containing protein [Streptomyces sp. NPDC051218]|uniref:FAS1-like dehydratase domain-containing protein n=1 Tax=Streptomyces sp. NPDC051218 TaxID=3365645 RepID=UPI00379B4F13